MLVLLLFVWIVGLFGTLLLSVGAVIYLTVTLVDSRPCPLRIPAGMLGGYIAGALSVWCLVPSQWELSFWTTLAATVNAEKYGHSVEHAAEGIVLWILFAAVVGAILGGVLAHIARHRLSRIRFAPAR